MNEHHVTNIEGEQQWWNWRQGRKEGDATAA